MYTPHTPADVADMLGRIGVDSIDALYADVPGELRMKAPYALPEGLSEQQVADTFDALADANRRHSLILAGGGFYDRYTPAAIPALMSRSEFATAYTPYQPEISQGTLQYIFEYQTIMAELTGLPVSNASMYDGATATAEAMMMAVASGRKRSRVLVSATLNPLYRNVVDTYARYHGVTIETVAETEAGVTDLEALKALLAAPEAKDIAGVVMPQPNCHGIVEDLTGVADAVHAAKALLIISGPAMPLATLRSPGEWGADIACGDAQSLGMPLSYGGPYLGYMTATKALMRKMPGRIVGATTDARGQRVFVLTLQAREQHIRRNKATSNICSNQGMMALFVDIYVALNGPRGLREINDRSRNAAVYLRDSLTATGRMTPAFPDSPFLNEFEMQADPALLDALAARCLQLGIVGGIRTASDRLLLATTERQSRRQIDSFVNTVKNLAL